MLEAYFRERAEGFPAEQGVYRTTFPDQRFFTPPAGVFLVAEDDDVAETAPGEAGPGAMDAAAEPLACGGVRRIQRDADAPVTFEVKHLWVRPEARGRRLGRAMLEELERRARAFGAGELVLDTNASLEAAGGLYRSSGFVTIEPYNDNPNATNWYGKRL
ncbi:GNAT family N-acetyltransferase [Agromyces archimandritae]|uniref:GNAT family N-acetyltransferase n=2 Tax=Agromyces archimandritae TaxID=2781962 RepID=A0A975IPZ5_9MICO|nr:GNAT family N-acetyltransferase [Agromyces archimandritae]